MRDEGIVTRGTPSGFDAYDEQERHRQKLLEMHGDVDDDDIKEWMNASPRKNITSINDAAWARKFQRPEGEEKKDQVSPPEPRHKKNLVAKTATDEYTNVAWMKKIRLEEQVIDTNSHEYKEETSPSQRKGLSLEEYTKRHGVNSAVQEEDPFGAFVADEPEEQQVQPVDMDRRKPLAGEPAWMRANRHRMIAEEELQFEEEVEEARASCPMHNNSCQSAVVDWCYRIDSTWLYSLLHDTF